MNFEKALKFLKDLARNNNRDWFEKNKTRYIESKEEFEVFVSDLLNDMIEFDDSLAGLNPKKLIFRIYRDVRFSKDKSPYKKNLSAAFSSEGKGLGTPGYYVHFQPNNESFVGIGLFQPVPDKLARIRQEIDYNFAAFKKIINKPAFKKTFGTLSTEEKLSRPPKNYDETNPAIEFIKLKSFTVGTKLTDAQVLSPGFAKDVAKIFKTMYPFIRYLNEAIN